MYSIKLCLTKFCMFFFSTREPIIFSFRLSLIESITSVATSDSSKLISNSNNTSSMSFSLRSFSLNPVDTLENAFFRLSNILLRFVLWRLHNLLHLLFSLFYICCNLLTLRISFLQCNF